MYILFYIFLYFCHNISSWFTQHILFQKYPQSLCGPHVLTNIYMLLFSVDTLRPCVEYVFCCFHGCYLVKTSSNQEVFSLHIHTSTQKYSALYCLAVVSILDTEQEKDGVCFTIVLLTVHNASVSESSIFSYQVLQN